MGSTDTLERAIIIVIFQTEQLKIFLLSVVFASRRSQIARLEFSRLFCELHRVASTFDT